MKTKKKVEKVGKKRTYNKRKNMEEEKKEGENVVPTEVVADSSTSVIEEKIVLEEEKAVITIKIAPFSGDFGRADINLLRDKVNEIIDFINSK